MMMMMMNRCSNGSIHICVQTHRRQFILYPVSLCNFVYLVCSLRTPTIRRRLEVKPAIYVNKYEKVSSDSNSSKIARIDILKLRHCQHRSRGAWT